MSKIEWKTCNATNSEYADVGKFRVIVLRRNNRFLPYPVTGSKDYATIEEAKAVVINSLRAGLLEAITLIDAQTQTHQTV